MRENCTYGSEGGVSQRLIPTPIITTIRTYLEVSTYSAGHLNTLAAVPCIIICTSAAGR